MRPTISAGSYTTRAPNEARHSSETKSWDRNSSETQYVRNRNSSETVIFSSDTLRVQYIDPLNVGTITFRNFYFRNYGEGSSLHVLEIQIKVIQLNIPISHCRIP